MTSKYRAVNASGLGWLAQVNIDYVGSNGQPVGWVDITSSPFFKEPEQAIHWAMDVWA